MICSKFRSFSSSAAGKLVPVDSKEAAAKSRLLLQGGRGRLTNGDNDFEQQLDSDSELFEARSLDKWQRLPPAVAHVVGRESSPGRGPR